MNRIDDRRTACPALEPPIGFPAAMCRFSASCTGVSCQNRT
jgi:hypothetical protein